MNSDTSLGIVGYAILGFFALLILIGALKGLRRGFARQVIRTITVLMAFVISILITRILQGALESWLYSQSISDLITSDGGITSVIAGVSQSTVEYVLAIPLYLIILPVIFVLLFMITSLLTGWIHLFLCKIFRFHKWNTKRASSKLFGALLGALQGLAVATVCVSPFVGLASSISVAVREMPEGEAKDTVVSVYNESIGAYTDDPIIEALNTFGAGSVYSIFTTAEINGSSYDMSKEIIGPTLKLVSAVTGIAEIDWQNITEEDKTTLNILVEVSEESPYMATILSDILSSLAASYKNGSVGVATSGLAKDLVEAFLSVFEGIDADSLSGTLAVIRDTLVMLSDEGAVAALGDSSADLTKISDIFAKKDAEGKTLIDRLTAKLRENERTAHLVSTITKISITAMSQNLSDGLGGIEVDEETYENVKEGLSDVVNIKKDEYETEEEYVGAISDSLNSTLVDNGIELDKALVDDMAQHVADNFGDKENLSDEEIDSIILSYYAAYLENQNSGTLPELPDIPNLPDIPEIPEIPENSEE